MRWQALVTGLLALVALSCADGSAFDWARKLVKSRLESQEMRIKDLGERLQYLVDQVAGFKGRALDASLEDIEHRVENLEGDDCKKNEMSCHNGQCVSNLLACDGVKDCENGHDEDPEDTCANPVMPGKAWDGHVEWKGCMGRAHNKVSIVITSNKRLPFLPSKILLTAIIAASYKENGRTKTDTYSTWGSYSFGSKQVRLQPPPQSDVNIGAVCDDAGKGMAFCRFLNEADLHECATAFLSSNN